MEQQLRLEQNGSMEHAVTILVVVVVVVEDDHGVVVGAKHDIPCLLLIQNSMGNEG